MINISGVSESRVAPAAAYYANQKDQSIIIVSTDVRAKRLASDLSFFVQDKEILTLPGEEQFLLRYAAKNQDQMITRLRALKALRTGQPVVIIAPVSAAVKKIAPHSYFEKSSFRVQLGEEIELEAVKRRLVELGYERMEIVDARGQFSVNGTSSAIISITDTFCHITDITAEPTSPGNAYYPVYGYGYGVLSNAKNMQVSQLHPAAANTLYVGEAREASGCRTWGPAARRSGR